MNLLITGAFKYDDNIIKDIENLGYKIYYQQFENGELQVDAKKIDMIICNALFLYHNIEEFKSLKYIQLTSAGYDRVPMEYVKKRGIIVYNAKNVYSVPIAEFVVMGILQLYKDAYGFFRKQAEHIWEKNRSIQELTGRRVAILGVGSIGTEVAKRLKSFDCEIVGFDIKEVENKYFNKIEVINRFDSYIETIDIVICCLPLTKETRYFFDEMRLNRLKRGAVLINVTRGKIVNEQVLCTLLETQKRLLGAILDVFEEEPLSSDSSLWELNNLIIFPHNAFIGNKNNERLYNVIKKNLMLISDIK